MNANHNDYRNIYNLAVELKIAMAVDFIVFGQEGAEPEAIIDTLCGWAFNSRHSAKGGDAHSRFVMAVDAFHAEQAKAA